jgi:hypothetical protein
MSQAPTREVLQVRDVFYQIRYYRNGQRIKESTGKTRYDEVRDLLRDREGGSKGVPITAKSTRLTFDDAVKDVINDYTINGKKSRDAVERNPNSQVALLQHLRADQFSRP